MAQGALYRPRLGAIDSREQRDIPGLRRLRLSAVCAGALLVLELVSIPFFSPRFAVREVIVRGDPRVAEQVIPKLALRGGTNFFRAPVRHLAQSAREVAAVRRAVVARSFPNRLVVTLERREAVAVIRRAEEAILVDPEGAVFTVRDEWAWGFPELVASHLTRAEVGSAAGKAQLAKLLNVLRALGPDPQLRVARLEVTDREGIEAALESGARVRLGSPQNLEVKVRLLSAVLDRLDVKGVEYIDLSDPRTAHWRPRSRAT